jgi:hypothetical protein
VKLCLAGEADFAFNQAWRERMGIRKKRLNLIIPDRAMERLEWLKDQTEAASHTEVIRQALFVYETLVERVADGSKLMERTSKGELLPLPVSIDVKPSPIVELKVAS